MQKCARTFRTCTARLPSNLHHPFYAPLPPRPWPHHGPSHHQHRLYTTISAADLNFGQPVYETHPHLLQPGELTPGLTSLEYAHRRNALASKLPPGGVAILAAASTKYKSTDVPYPYHQDSNFRYLTGFLEPDCVAVISRPLSTSNVGGKGGVGEGGGEGGGGHEFHLYVLPKDPKEEQWSGPRSGVQAAYDVFNADYAGDILTSTSQIREVLNSAREIYTDIPSLSSSSSSTKDSRSLLSRLTQPSSPSTNSLSSILPPNTTTHALSPLLHRQRLIKSPAELSLLRRCGQASGRALTSTMAHSHSRKPFPSESALHTHLHHQFSLRNLSEAYIPVIAGGPRASIIHYLSNNALLSPSELVLVDAGGELGGYVSDITRTWPISGKFSEEQRELYEAVLNVQRDCIGRCRANARMTLDKLHAHAEDLLRSELSQLGFAVTGSGGQKMLTTLFPHHISHYIGLDVHDTPTIGRQEKLREGMVVSVEPGVYVPDTEEYPARFRGMGIRIEDTVAVGAEGPTVCSVEAVKEVDDIEALRD